MLGRPVLITLVLLAGTLGLAALLRPRVNVSELRRAIARDLTPGTSAVRPHLLSDGIFLEFRLDTSFALVQAEVHESWTMP